MTSPSRDPVQEARERVRKKTAEDFWAQVAIGDPDDCWPWRGRSFNKRTGYGLAYWNRTNMAASRVAWILTAQITPPRHLFVCHTCHNPPCCNPAHLYLGTASVNACDAVQAGRHNFGARTHCKNGHPLSGANVRLYLSPTRKNPFRRCVACNRTYDRKWRLRERASRVTVSAVRRVIEKVEALGRHFPSHAIPGMMVCSDETQDSVWVNVESVLAVLRAELSEGRTK